MEEKIIRKNFNIKRGMIALCNLGEGIGSEQLGKRPCVIVQNDTGNKFSPTVVVAPLTSKNWKTKLPTQAEINIIDSGAIEKNSLALCEQLRTIDKTRVEKIYGSVSEKDMVNINDALIRSLEIEKEYHLKVKEQVIVLITIEKIILDLLELVDNDVIEKLIHKYNEEMDKFKKVCSIYELKEENYYKASRKITSILLTK